MHLEIITPDNKIYSGKVTLVQLPGKDGSLEILKNHAAMITALKKGKMRIVETDKQVKFFDINGGVAEVLNNVILVLAE
jgi:F-type H+-transporting ATPase subunit epsilon